MFILFTLIVMRISGAVLFNPVLGRRNIPVMIKSAFILVLSLMLYAYVGGTLAKEPSSLIEYGIMLVMEMFLGFVIGFCMELFFMVVNFASSVMDFSMGLSMAQVYDPQYNVQMTVTSGLYYAFMTMLFFAVGGHLELIRIIVSTAQTIPFGSVGLNAALSETMLRVFADCILLGLRLAFPIIAVELVTEFTAGILMRTIPQINVFVVNFQMKLIAGFLMLLILFSPLSDYIYQNIESMMTAIRELMTYFY